MFAIEIFQQLAIKKMSIDSKILDGFDSTGY